MAHTHALRAISQLSPRIRLDRPVEMLAQEYKSAKPFPHVVIDNLLDDQLLDQLVREMPPLHDGKYMNYDDGHLTRYGLRSATELGETGFQLISLLHSAAFLYFLSEITGIRELLPDPYLQGGGYHVMPPGGKFDVHADRNIAYETGLARRLSLIIYLNKAWQHEYGGQLELWNHDGTRQEVVIEPLFNRTVIFEIADQNFHGVPVPIANPDGRCRSSFAVYYHTAQPLNMTPHSSLFRTGLPTRKASKSETALRIARDLCPPIVARAVRRILGRK